MGYGGSDVVLVAVVATFALWRRVGGFLQQNVTTRPATPSQLQSGITAAEQLMERYQHRPDAPLRMPRRIWNMGILQVMAGSTLVIGVWWLVTLVLPVPEAFRLVLF